MSHVRVSQSLNLRFGVFTVLLFHTVLLGLIHPCRGQQWVIGPSQPIIAIVGEDVILPCQLQPAVSAARITFEWTRPDLDPRFVHVSRWGVNLQDLQHPSYEGRTSLFTAELEHGNISLKLSNVKTSDEGRYRCFLPELDIDSHVQLVVGAASSPVVQMTKNSSTVVVKCESEGWYPEPEVSWLDGEGHVLSAGPTETVRGPDGLYTVSSRVTVEKRHRNSFTCRVQQKDTNQIRETQIHVPGEFFVDLSGSSSTSSSPAPAIIGLVVGIMLILAAVFAVWKWRQNRISNKKHPEDEETLREKRGGNKSEQQSLLQADRQELTAESETVNNLDKLEEDTGLQTQIHEETHQRESNNTQPDLQPPTEGGTRSGLDQFQEQRGTEPISDTRDAPNPAESNSNKGVTEYMTTLHDKTEVQCLKEEEKHEETLNDKEKDTLMKKLKTKEREVGKFEEFVSRLESQMKIKKEQIKELNQQLEEVERQREETERKIQSVDRQEDKDEADKLPLDTKNDLERKKEELKKQLEKREKDLERIKKEVTNATNNKIKATNEKEEIIKRLKRSENQNDPVNSLIDEEGQTGNNLQTEEEKEDKNTLHDKTEVQCLKEEEKHEETLNDKEKDTLMKKLKTKEREVGKFEESVSRYESQMKVKEEQIKELNQQLQEVERQREETERKIQSVDRHEDKDEADKLRLDTKNDLERKKEELKKLLEKREKDLERIKKDVIAITNKKIKATNEKEEIIKRLNRSEDQSVPVDSLFDVISGIKLS